LTFFTYLAEADVERSHEIAASVLRVVMAMESQLAEYWNRAATDLTSTILEAFQRKTEAKMARSCHRVGSEVLLRDHAKRKVARHRDTRALTELR
jgi:hypothetical protein